TASRLTITRSTFRDNVYGSVNVLAGTASLDGYVADDSGNGLILSSAATDVLLVNSILSNNSSSGISYATQSATVVNVINCTIHGNFRGVNVVDAVVGGAVNLRNSIVSNNSSSGVRRFSSSPATVSVTYSNVW